MEKIRRNAKKKIEDIARRATGMKCYSLDNNFSGQPIDLSFTTPEKVIRHRMADRSSDMVREDDGTYRLRVHGNLWFKFRVHPFELPPRPVAPPEIDPNDGAHKAPAAYGKLEFYAFGRPEPEGEDWRYVVDDYGILYGPGPWPFYHHPHDGPANAKPIPCGVRLAPDHDYGAGSNLYVSAKPSHRKVDACYLNYHVALPPNDPDKTRYGHGVHECGPAYAEIDLAERKVTTICCPAVFFVRGANAPIARARCGEPVGTGRPRMISVTKGDPSNGWRIVPPAPGETHALLPAPTAAPWCAHSFPGTSTGLLSLWGTAFAAFRFAAIRVKKCNGGPHMASHEHAESLEFHPGEEPAVPAPVDIAPLLAVPGEEALDPVPVGSEADARSAAASEGTGLTGAVDDPAAAG